MGTQHSEQSTAPITAQPLALDTPAHIRRLQRTIYQQDAATFAERPETRRFVRRAAIGEFWPYAVAYSDHVLVYRDGAGSIVKAPLSRGERHYTLVAATDALFRQLTDYQGHPNPHNLDAYFYDQLWRFEPVHLEDADPEERAALVAAWRVWGAGGKGALRWYW